MIKYDDLQINNIIWGIYNNKVESKTISNKSIQTITFTDNTGITTTSNTCFTCTDGTILIGDYFFTTKEELINSL